MKKHLRLLYEVALVQKCTSVWLIKLLIMSDDTTTPFGFVLLLWRLFGGQPAGGLRRKVTLSMRNCLHPPANLLISC